MGWRFLASGRLRRSHWPASEVVHYAVKIGVAHNSHDLALRQDRHLLDFVVFQKSCDLGQWRVRSRGHDIAGHYIADFAGRRPEKFQRMDVGSRSPQPIGAGSVQWPFRRCDADRPR